MILLPVSGFFHTGLQITADRYSYLSCLPWALLVGAASLFEWPITAGVLGLLLCGLGLFTRQLVHVWSDSASLWVRVLEIDPHSALAYTNLARARLEQGDTPGAIENLNKALEMDPNFAFAHNNIGSLLLLRGEVQEAEEPFSSGARL